MPPHETATEGPSKKLKPSSLMHRYPIKLHKPSAEDEEGIEKQMDALQAEMVKERPRDVLLLPLMKSTFSARRSVIQNEDQPVSCIYIYNNDDNIKTNNYKSTMYVYILSKVFTHAYACHNYYNMYVCMVLQV